MKGEIGLSHMKVPHGESFDHYDCLNDYPTPQAEKIDTVLGDEERFAVKMANALRNKN